MILICNCEKKSLQDILIMRHFLNINSNIIRIIKIGIIKNAIIPMSNIGLDIIENCSGLIINMQSIMAKLIIQIILT